MNSKKMILLGLTFASTAVFASTTHADEQTKQVTVRDGDTLTQIAANNNTDVQSIVSLNKITDANLIHPGDVLKVTEGKTTKEETKAQTSAQFDYYYVNNAGETVWFKAANQQEADTYALSQADYPHAQVATSSIQYATSTQATPPSAQAQTIYNQAVQTAGSGSVYDQFIASGGTAAMWASIVMPESSGNPNAVSPNGYQGLGQTKEGWGTGSVATQTQGMINYAISRYGSIDAAIAFRQANGWW
ncbi:MAG: LysM peptidoglycan-binding domain-containing protein [Streptococcaceae bacterium]|jgi:LysM repeat protein|nr:LysM peptidoglycan-binding domain-containing protein [Streptococcaceae bacterium]